MTAEAISKNPDQPMYNFSVLRELRKRAKLTLEELSARSGISPAVISKMERNLTTAELETIFRLARVFGLSATDLISLAEAPLAHRTTPIAYRSGDFRFRRISYANLSIFEGETKAGGRVSRPEIHGDDLETCWVLEGRVRLVLAHETMELSAGESVQFDAIREHRYEALEDTRLILLHLRKEKRY